MNYARLEGWLRTMRDRTADGVNDIIGDEQVGIRPFRSKRTIAVEPQLRASLPPTVLRGDHPGMMQHANSYLPSNFEHYIAP